MNRLWENDWINTWCEIRAQPPRPESLVPLATHREPSALYCWILEILFCTPKGRRALLRIPSTEGRSVCLCWAPSKPKGPKGRPRVSSLLFLSSRAEMGANLPLVDLGAGRTAVAVSAGGQHSCALLVRLEREFFIDNLLVRVHRCFWCTGLAPWEFEFPFPGSLISTFQWWSMCYGG